MLELAAAAATCWLCTLIAIPRRPRWGNEVEELVYARLLGRQQRLVLVAVIATSLVLGALLFSLPQHAGGRSVPNTERKPVCTSAPDRPAVCYTPQPDGTWEVERLRGNGTWERIGIERRPPSPDELARGSS